MCPTREGGIDSRRSKRCADFKGEGERRAGSNLRNQVIPVLLLLETAEGHLGARDVLLGVLEVREEGVMFPHDALLLVGISVGVAVDGARLAAEEAVQSGTDLVAAAALDGVALGATGLEEVGTLLSVSCKGGKQTRQRYERGYMCDRATAA